MKKINFEKVKVSMDIEGKDFSEQNVKKDFANLIYQQGKGIEYHALALKIFNSRGGVEYSEDERKLIEQASLTCAPFFIDAIKRVLKDVEKEKSGSAK